MIGLIGDCFDREHKFSKPGPPCFHRPPPLASAEGSPCADGMISVAPGHGVNLERVTIIKLEQLCVLQSKECVPTGSTVTQPRHLNDVDSSCICMRRSRGGHEVAEDDDIHAIKEIAHRSEQLEASADDHPDEQH